MLGWVSPAANLHRLLQRAAGDRPARGRSTCRISTRVPEPCSAGVNGGVNLEPPLRFLYSLGHFRTNDFPTGGNYSHLSTPTLKNGCVSP